MRAKSCHRGINQHYGLLGLGPWGLAAVALGFMAWTRLFGRPLRGTLGVLTVAYGLRYLGAQRLPGTPLALLRYLGEGAAFAALGRDPLPAYSSPQTRQLGGCRHA